MCFWQCYPMLSTFGLIVTDLDSFSNIQVPANVSFTADPTNPDFIVLPAIVNISDV